VWREKKVGILAELPEHQAETLIFAGRNKNPVGGDEIAAIG